MLDITVADLGDMNKPVLMYPDIDESAKVNDITHGSLQYHSRCQILHFENIAAQDWLRHVFTRITCRLLQFFYNIAKGQFTNFKLCRKFLVIRNLFRDSDHRTVADIFQCISQFL